MVFMVEFMVFSLHELIQGEFEMSQRSFTILELDNPDHKSIQ